MTSNESAERLRAYIGRHPEGTELIDAALAAERRATVERIRAAMYAGLDGPYEHNGAVWISEVYNILEREAAR